MNQEEKIKALKEAILEANTKETYGLYKIKNTIVSANDLDTLIEALDILEAGFNLNSYLILTKEQRRLFKAYEIDIEKGKNLTIDDIKEYEEKRREKKGN